MSAIGWVMIANSSNCLISPGLLASIEGGDSIINATLLYKGSIMFLSFTGLLHIMIMYYNIKLILVCGFMQQRLSGDNSVKQLLST